MPLLDVIALCIVAATGAYFFALGGAALLTPARVSQFLLGFASSLATHLLELALRLIVGAAFVLAARRLWFSGGFSIFGWVLVVSTACLLIVPWRWHQRFAQRVVPLANRHLTLIGLVSVALGAFILLAAVNGGAA